MSELASAIERMADHYRPHAVSPVTARRKATDTADPAYSDGNRATVLAGVSYPVRTHNGPDTNANRRHGGRYPGYYRPRTEDLAGMDPATTRPAYGSVKPSGGRRIGVSVKQAHADSENAGYAAWVSAHHGLIQAAADPFDVAYPQGLTAGGNLAPPARY